MAIEHLERVIISNDTQANVESLVGSLVEIVFGRNTVTGSIGYSIDSGVTWTWLPTVAGAVSTLNDLTDVTTSGQATGDVLYKSSGDWTPYALGLGSKITMDGSKIKFGNVSGGNYLEIDTSTGNLRLVGNATQWDDIRIEPTVRSSGVKVPSYAAYKSGIYAYEFDNALVASEKEVNFKMQMPHGWKTASAIHLHVHWIAKATGSAGDKVRWGLEYTKANINGVFGATTTIYATDPESPPSTTPTADTHYLTEFSSIDMTGMTLSNFILCRLFRNSSDAADTYGDSAYLIGIDAHIELDSWGSDAELVKDSSASVLLNSGNYLLLNSGDKLLLNG